MAKGGLGWDKGKLLIAFIGRMLFGPGFCRISRFYYAFMQGWFWRDVDGWVLRGLKALLLRQASIRG